MPRGTSLSEYEQGIIFGMNENGAQIKQIAKRLKRHRNTITNFLKDPSSYGTAKRSGRKTNIDARCKRRMQHLAVIEGMSSGQIKSQMGLHITRNRIVQILHENPKITHTSMTRQPNLLPRHINARLAFATKYQFWDEEWRNVIFSDEKKFNLDGPDCYKKYWRHKDQSRRSCLSRVHGGGSVMIWAAFCYEGKTPVCFISTKMNAEMYVNLLDDELIEFAGQLYGDNWTFQQDNAPIHCAKRSKEFFTARNIPLLQWPAISPDLNPIEDLWGILSGKVYKNGRQFETARELKIAIEQEWRNISPSNLKSLVNSMPFRLSQVILKKGKHINY